MKQKTAKWSPVLDLPPAGSGHAGGRRGMLRPSRESLKQEWQEDLRGALLPPQSGLEGLFIYLILVHLFVFISIIVH